MATVHDITPGSKFEHGEDFQNFQGVYKLKVMTP